MRLLVIGLVWVGGAVLGWDTAAVTHGSNDHAAVVPVKDTAPDVDAGRQSSTLVVVPVPSRSSGDERRLKELERLQTRNRRLEALVLVLRNREGERQP